MLLERLKEKFEDVFVPAGFWESDELKELIEADEEGFRQVLENPTSSLMEYGSFMDWILDGRELSTEDLIEIVEAGVILGQESDVDIESDNDALFVLADVLAGGDLIFYVYGPHVYVFRLF